MYVWKYKTVSTGTHTLDFCMIPEFQYIGIASDQGLKSVKCQAYKQMHNIYAYEINTLTLSWHDVLSSEIHFAASSATIPI